MFILFFMLLQCTSATHMYPIPTEQLDLNNYYYYKKGFTEEEVTKIKNIASEITTQEGVVSTIEVDSNGKNKLVNQKNDIRVSTIKWIPDTDETKWLYDKIFKLAKQANDNIYHFDLTHIQDSLQYTTYTGESKGKYEWHVDLGQSTSALRKLSMVVLLSDPKTDFQGGQLQLRKGNKIINAPLNNIGSVVFFPSYLLHQVVPVTAGKRESLVAWVSGYPFK